MIRRHVLLCWVALAAVGLAGCQAPADPFKAPPDVAGPPPDALRTPSGIASKVLHVGLGSVRPSLDSRVTVHYTGWTTDGRMFESTIGSGSPPTFGVAEVIPGWTEILQQMVKGEKRRVWIPGHLAYDNSPNPEAPRGMLVFDMEIIEVR